MGISISPEMRQTQTISPMMLQQVEILQMNSKELDEYLRDLSCENPLVDLENTKTVDIESADRKRKEIERKLEWLESVDITNKVYYQEDRSEDSEFTVFDVYSKDEGTELSDYLLSQLNSDDYEENEWDALTFLVDSLDAGGYFKEELSLVAGEYDLTPKRAEELLRDLQSLEPAGIAARSLQECLLIQSEASTDLDGDLLETEKMLISDYLEDIAKNHIAVIARKSGQPAEVVQVICEHIKRFNPKPANGFGMRENMQYVTPDVVVVKVENELDILLPNQSSASFSINGYYRNMLKQCEDKETLDYLGDKLKQAEWVKNCLAQRENTLERVARELVEYQLEFFVNGPKFKKPMRLVDLSEKLEVHESTVSRALRGKFLQCSYGIFPLNYFLSSSVAVSDNEEKTSDQVKDVIQEIVDGENKSKPYSDQKISDLLKARGMDISRRTVNKYRTQMGIPDKSGRKIEA